MVILCRLFREVDNNIIDRLCRIYLADPMFLSQREIDVSIGLQEILLPFKIV